MAGHLDALLGGSFAGGLIDAFSNIGANKRAKELAKYQYDLNMQAWREQNEYNKPINQVERLQEAGLNPQLAYGNGSQAGNASPAPQYQAPTLQKVQGFGNAFTSGIQNALSMYQMKLNEQKLIAEQELMKSQADHFRALKNKAGIESMYILSRKTGQDISNNMLDFQQSVQQETYDRQVEEWQRQQELLSIQINVENQRINTMKAEERLKLAQSTTEIFKRRLMSAQANQANAAASLSRAQSNLVNNQVNVFGENFRLHQALTWTQIDKMGNEIGQLIKTGKLTEANLSKVLKDLDWYEADKVMKYLMSTVQMQTQMINAGANLVNAVVPM